MLEFNENYVKNHTGVYYTKVLSWLHELIKPDLYLEIGALNGVSLALSSCETVAVDPLFRLIGSSFIEKKEVLHLYQMTSDSFFERYACRLPRRIGLAFLDGLHHSEFLLRDFYNAERYSSFSGMIVMHDCLPLDLPMASRVFNPELSMPQRQGWWAGDVWRVLAALRKFRPDLTMTCLDASPTGLVVVSGLDPHSRLLPIEYKRVVAYMHSLDLERITVRKFLEEADVVPAPSKEALVDILRTGKSLSPEALMPMAP